MDGKAYLYLFHSLDSTVLPEKQLEASVAISDRLTRANRVIDIAAMIDPKAASLIHGIDSKL